MTKLSTTLLRDLPIKQTSITDEDYVVVSSGGTKKLKVKDITKGVEKKAADLEVKTTELRSDLDKKTNELKIEKVNRNELSFKVWSMANMGQDIKEAMTGGSVAVVGKYGVLSENVAPKQITASKLNDNSSKAFIYEWC